MYGFYIRKYCVFARQNYRTDFTLCLSQFEWNTHLLVEEDGHMCNYSTTPCPSVTKAPTKKQTAAAKKESSSSEDSSDSEDEEESKAPAKVRGYLQRGQGMDHE